MEHPKRSRSLSWILPLGLGALACESTPPSSRAAEEAPVLALEEAPGEPVSEVLEPERDYPWPYELIEGEPIFKLMEHDDLPSIDAPEFVEAELADDFMDLDEVVLGVLGKDGTAKCYSAWQLDSHEIVNDELDGQPIAATW